ncbi:PREDICTED: preprotein translocase subunit SECE1 [Tarenaya hassleriana]|uniref:preprotein translocase subunit SECE1 n=1 Tax=Tarenaya hassleriana TaxID=28532 RepID=UPI00053C21DC|nr:PREDICTED: preprotein translocase subunit SECE1 [Tarenaya hassleriana]
MPLSVNLSPPVTGTIRSHRRTASLCESPSASQRFFPIHPDVRCSAISASTRLLRKPPCVVVAKAIEQSRDTTESEPESDSPASEGGKYAEEEQSLIGAEIKAAMEQRKSAAEEDRGKSELLSGVAEEVREIEWPAFQKVLGTTGVVLGVIAGSSVVLLTVNFILAELSDRVFAGKGVQDFFS